MILPNWLKEDNVLSQVNFHHNHSKDKSQEKIDRLLERKALYNNVEDQKEKTYVRLIYSTIQTLIALYYKDSPTVRFSGRQLGDEEYAKNLNRLQKFDFTEMGLDKLMYYVQWDKFFSWVGLQVLQWWDKHGLHPLTKLMSPECWYPDIDYDVNTGFKYHGFKLMVDKRELANKGFFNLKELKKHDQLKLEKMIEEEVNKGYSEDMARKVLYERDPRLLQTQDQDDVESYEVLVQYERFDDGRPYMVTTANEGALLLGLHELKPVLSEEKVAPHKIEYPVIARNRSPLKWDPWGVSVCDLLEDKQRAIQLFQFLNKLKAENEAWGDMFLFDPNIIEDINDLKKPWTWPKYIAANLSQGGTPLLEVPKARVKSDSYNMPEILRAQSERDIGMDAALMGISPQEGRTATEHQRVQRNANLRMILGAKVDAWAEKKFWKLWYRSYYKNFPENSEKHIYLNNGMGQVPYPVKKKDLMMKGDIDVEILSTSELDEINEKKKIGFMTTITPVLQNPWSVYSKNFALRKMYTLNGMTEEESYVLVPEAPEEIQAKMDLELLNRDEDVAKIRNMNEDHATYLAIYQQALNTPAKFRAISKRKEALLMASQQQQQPQQPSAELDNMQSQLTSNMIQRTNTSDAASLLDV